MKYEFRGDVPRADGRPLYGGYPETRAAIEQYYATDRSIEWLRKTQDAFARESSVPAEEIGTMSPSYIRWLIEGGKSMY